MLPIPNLSGAYSSSAVHKNPGKIPASIFPSRQCFREDNAARHREALPYLQLLLCTTSFALTGQLRDKYTLQNSCMLHSWCPSVHTLSWFFHTSALWSSENRQNALYSLRGDSNNYIQGFFLTGTEFFSCSPRWRKQLPQYSSNFKKCKKTPRKKPQTSKFHPVTLLSSSLLKKLWRKH